MKAWKKIAIGVGIALLLAIIVGFTVHQSSKNVTTVQTGKVHRQDLATVVSASGEIKPKTYVNIGAMPGSAFAIALRYAGRSPMRSR